MCTGNQREKTRPLQRTLAMSSAQLCVRLGLGMTCRDAFSAQPALCCTAVLHGARAASRQLHASPSLLAVEHALRELQQRASMLRSMRRGCICRQWSETRGSCQHAVQERPAPCSGAGAPGAQLYRQTS